MKTLARRALEAGPLALLLVSAGCAHLPAEQGRAARAPAVRADGALPAVSLDPDEAYDAGERVLVTGSRLPQPMTRNGIPLTYSNVRIIYWRQQQDLRTLHLADPAFQWGR